MSRRAPGLPTSFTSPAAAGDAGSVPRLRYAAHLPDVAPLPLTRRCIDWLLGYLFAAGRPVRPCDMVEAARQAGFPRGTLYRARRALAGQVVDLGNSPHDPANLWTHVVFAKRRPQP